jgi:hypothetical protein
MPTQTISMLHVAIGFLSVILFWKALKVIVDQSKKFLVNKNDSFETLRNEVNALKVELNILKTEVMTSSAKIDQTNLIPTSATSSQVMLEEMWLRGNSDIQSIHCDTWTRHALLSDRPLTPSINSSGDSWTRDALAENTAIMPTIGQVTSDDTWTREAFPSEPAIQSTAGDASDNKSLVKPSIPSLESNSICPTHQLGTDRHQGNLTLSTASN